MLNPEKIAQRFLQEMNSNDFFTNLDVLIESLEEKIDPDPLEIYLLETLYEFKQKLKITESKLNNYVVKSKDSLPENKLDSLYNSLTGYGTSKLFND